MNKTVIKQKLISNVKSQFLQVSKIGKCLACSDQEKQDNRYKCKYYE